MYIHNHHHHNNNNNDSFGKGRLGSALWTTAASLIVVVDRRTFWVLPVTYLSYFYLPKSARASVFPQSVKIDYFCSGLIRVDPICPQPKAASLGFVLLPLLSLLLLLLFLFICFDIISINNNE